MLNLTENEEVIFKDSNIKGLGSAHDSILNELITTNKRIIAKYSKENFTIPFDKISQVRINLQKGGFLGKAIPAFFWFVLGVGMMGSQGLSLLFFALSIVFGYLAYRGLQGTTYLYIDTIDGSSIHFWQKGKSDHLIYCKECIEQYL